MKDNQPDKPLWLEAQLPRLIALGLLLALGCCTFSHHGIWNF